MNEFVVVGKALSDVELKKSESGIVYAQLVVSVRKAFKAKDGDDNDILQFTLFKNCAEEAKDHISDGTPIIIKGHINGNSHSKDGKVYYDASLIADRISLINDLI